MSSLEHINSIITNSIITNVKEDTFKINDSILAFINILYKICKPYNNCHISCTIIGKYLQQKNCIIKKKLYHKIVQLINANYITFLTPSTDAYVQYDKSFYVLIASHAIKSPIASHAIKSPTILDIIYILYEYIIVNGIYKKKHEIYILSNNLEGFYKKNNLIRQIIKLNGGIKLFVKKYSNNLIYINNYFIKKSCKNIEKLFKLTVEN